MTYVIEKNVPMPVRRGAYPIAEMEVGDSFFFDGDEKKARAVRSSAFNLKDGHTYVIRAVDGGYRLWRTA